MTIFWFRRDLRLHDNTALFEAFENENNVQPIFIFDDKILSELPENDPRVNFIYDELKKIHEKLSLKGGALQIHKGEPLEIWRNMIAENNIDAVYFNHDYEPYARKRDKAVYELLKTKGIKIVNKKDQVIFEKSEVTKDDGKPYTVYTPYKNKWLKKYLDNPITLKAEPAFNHLNQVKYNFPSKNELRIVPSEIEVKPFSLNEIEIYDELRNFPSKDAGSYLGPHLRFGTVSTRELVLEAEKRNATFLSELIWREFFM